MTQRQLMIVGGLVLVGLIWTDNAKEVP
ncbi:MAG: hypothetical protein ACI9EF_002588, partial [Pseudohongiellaceae bacterium]